MSANRIVVLFSPIFVGVAGAVVSWIAKNFPGGPVLDRGELTAVFIAGAGLAAAKVALWLRGWQTQERDVLNQHQAVERKALNDPAPTAETSARSALAPEPPAKPEAAPHPAHAARPGTHKKHT